MKTYRLWFYEPLSNIWIASARPPVKFTTLEEAQVELVKRTFDHNLQYKIVESEEQQS